MIVMVALLNYYLAVARRRLVVSENSTEIGDTTKRTCSLTHFHVTAVSNYDPRYSAAYLA